MEEEKKVLIAQMTPLWRRLGLLSSLPPSSSLTALYLVNYNLDK